VSPINIGDFDSAWENYDHESGPELIDDAKEPIKTGDIRPNWRLKIGTRDMTRRLIECEVTFNATDGASAMTLKVANQLHKQGYERARVQLWIGYGNKLIPFFRGKLERPVDGPSGLYSDATAYGIATQLGARHFGHRVSYAGFTVRDFFWDIVEKFGADQDRFFMDGEHDQVIESEDSEGGTAEFGIEHTYLEAIQAVLPQMEFVGFDQTGGMFVVKKPDRQDAVTRASLSGILDDSHYPPGGFEFGESFKNMYSKVVVFRRTEEYAGGGAAQTGGTGMTEEDGYSVPEDFYGSDADHPDAVAGNRSKPKAAEYAVYAERDVTNSGGWNVHGGRAYVIPDFPGQQEHAENTAQWWADAFSAGVGRYSLRDISPIDFALYDYFGLERREERRTPEGEASFGQLHWTSRGDIYDILYACQVESMTLRIAPQTFRMDLEGPAVVVEETLVTEATDLTQIDHFIPPDDDTPPEPEGETAALKATADDVKVGADRVVSGG
jgi:hypothetical protein